MQKIIMTVALVLGLTTGGASAENVTLIVPFSAGGPMDQIGRVIAPALQDELGQTVIVDNRPGAGGVIGMNAAAVAKPDGNTLVLTGQGHVLSSLTQKSKLPYKPLDSFSMIALVGKLPAALVTRKDLPVENLADVQKLAMQKKLHFGSSGVGNSPHLAGEMMNAAMGTQMVHVPYAGVGPVIADLIAGNVDMVVADLPVVISHVKAGTLKGIAVFGSERAEVMPDLPTSAEEGFADLVTGNYYYVLGPAGLSDEKRSRLEQAVLAATARPETAKALKAAGLGEPANGAALHELLAAELKKWEPYVKKLNLDSN
ncbi:tripartite tricarboxylate transporter substrate binding protein [Agrobacterium sp. T29]|uniref:Bug family tripartite tricarboxylate transporter substrate binding protein n=1 Tax=Agrobacterium sp. T29 TaxID=2580515 RepID=UPI00115DE51C|nr:tripartite tricarboxylate transporter substrate binding protein [Agrobacterium sp. T29]